ncbi:MAG: hypothetical protein V7K27_10135 [Nostoc sp.]|uniref:hypothetical protein n=1 Tax=Nostoc sp. TaxID=1180 RepID=UPI002FFB41E6
MMGKHPDMISLALTIFFVAQSGWLRFNSLLKSIFLTNRVRVSVSPWEKDAKDAKEEKKQKEEKKEKEEKEEMLN